MRRPKTLLVDLVGWAVLLFWAVTQVNVLNERNCLTEAFPFSPTITISFTITITISLLLSSTKNKSFLFSQQYFLKPVYDFYSFRQMD